MRTVSTACAMPGMASRVAAVIAASTWRLVIFIVTFPFVFCDLGRSFALFGSSRFADLRNSGRCEFDEMHGRQEVLCQGRDGGIGIAPDNGMHDRGVFGFDLPDHPGFAADRKPAIALALLVQDIAKTEQPLRAAGIHQRPVEDAVTFDPHLIMGLRIVRMT